MGPNRRSRAQARSARTAPLLDLPPHSPADSRPLRRPRPGRNPRPRQSPVAVRRGKREPISRSWFPAPLPPRTLPPSRPPEQYGYTRRAKRWTTLEERQPIVLDPLEHPHAAKPGEAQLGPQTAAHAVAHSPAFAEELACDAEATFERTPPRRTDGAARELGFVGAGDHLHFSRDV